MPILQSDDVDSLDYRSEKKTDESVNLTDELLDDERLLEAFPFHLLFTSEFDIHVFSGLQAHRNHPSLCAYDSVICTRPLSQKMPLALPDLGEIERLNMILQIPELGAVAIANQVGRVTLLTMTKSVEYQCGFRIDWILPLRSQEEQDLRPEEALMGMAVGPIQGREALQNYSRFDRPEQHWNEVGNPLEYPRRFRLFLIYRDHTVLSYEITRLPAANDLGVQDRIILP